MPTASAKKICSTLTRTFELDRAAMDEEKRTIELSFSSEHPVERWFGVEILDHSPSSVDLSRLNAGAPLLVNHDTRAQCGVVERAEVREGKGYAKVRFSRSACGEEIFQDVKDGIRRLVSVGYRLMDNKLVEQSEVEGKETYRFKRWQPYEVSIVPVPADPTVGVGRGAEETTKNDFELPMKRNLLLNAAATDGGGTATDKPDLVAAERTRTGEIRKLGKQFRGRITDVDDLVDSAIDGNTPVADFQRSLLGKLSTAPIPGGSEELERKEGTETASSGGGQKSNTETRSLGEMFTASREYRDKIKAGRPREISVEIRATLPEMMQRATLTSSGLTSIQKIPGVVLVDQQPLRVADIFSQGTTSSTTIRFTKESSFTNGATAVAEEGQKPEASFALAESDVTVKKIAVVGRVTDEMLSDYEYAQSYVNSRLLFMVAALEDNHLLNGSGNSNQITGILNVSGIQTQAVSGTLADSIHKAITKIMSTPGFIGAPEHLVIHPTDWQNLVLTKDSNGQYYAGGPFMGQYGVGGISRSGPWGLTPVVTTAIAQGTALVAAGRLGATIFRRQGITIESTNSDASDFQYNRIAIRAEERLCLVPFRPAAFCKITGIV